MGTFFAVTAAMLAIIAAFAPLAAPALFFFLSVPLLITVFVLATIP